MRFTRNIIVLSLLVAILGTLLWVTETFRSDKPLLAGDALFDLSPEAITVIQWDVVNDNGEKQTITLNRQGALWRMEAPYAGLLCDRAVIANFLDTLQSLKVEAALTDAPASLFKAHRQLILATPDRRVICEFAAPSVMNLSQVLANCNDHLVTVSAKTVDALPSNVRDLWSRAVLPVTAETLASMEWRATGQPFTRAIRRSDRLWTVTQPFAFDPSEEAVKQAIAALVAPQAISAYIRPAPGETTLTALSETMLAAYGLDEEYAIRVTIRVKGLSEALQLRFGKNDPTRPEHVYCLLDGRQTIVSVPQNLRTLFTDNGPFASGHTELPLLADIGTPEKITVAGQTKSETITVSRQQNTWHLTTPTELPADTLAVNQMLQKLTTLTGDLTEDLIPVETNRLCTLAFDVKKQPSPIVVACYHSPKPDHLLLYRADTNRLYTLPTQSWPEVLQTPRLLTRALADHTILSLPADSIRRITVQRNGVDSETVRRLPDSTEWSTEFPQGAYVNTAIIDQWLTLCADLQATTILEEVTSGAPTLTALQFNQPLARITLDLDGRSEQLRRILIISPEVTEGGLVPVMIQGCPLIYAVHQNVLAPFLLSLTTTEMSK